MASVITSQNRAVFLGTWALRLALAAVFISASVMKLSGQPFTVAEFDTVGLGQWFRYFTGVLELVGGIALLIPRSSVLGAVLLLIVDLGAGVAQVAVLHGDWIHTVVIAALLLLLIYLQRSAPHRLAEQ